MMVARKVIAVLINYQDAMRTFHCIESLHKNTVDQIIVWDNSEDGGVSLSALKTHIAGMHNVETISSEKNLGFSKAINHLLILCQQMHPHSYVLVINNDALLLADGATTLVKAIEQSNDYVMAVPMINNAGCVTEASFYHKWSGLLSFHEKKGYFRYPSGCCFLVKIDQINIPFFDEHFFMYGEDWELGWRLPSNTINYVYKVLVDHEGSASSGLGSKFYEERMVAAHLILARKIAKNNLEYILMIILRLVMLSLRASLRSIRFGSPIPLYALFLGIKIAWFTE